MEWISVKDELPRLSDRSVIVDFATGSVGMVHVEDYFGDIGNGVVDGVQQYTKWYITAGVTHWMECPESNN